MKLDTHKKEFLRELKKLFEEYEVEIDYWYEEDTIKIEFMDESYPNTIDCGDSITEDFIEELLNE